MIWFDVYSALPPGEKGEPTTGGAILMAVAISSVIFRIWSVVMMLVGASLFCGG
jgi:hypothetical protein